MRKISEDSTRAFLNGKTFKRDNTEVEISENKKYSFMYLFGNWIARKNLENGNININNCGYPTVTTKDRLNAIIYYSDYKHNYSHIFQKNHTWFIYKHTTDKKGSIVDGYATPFKSRNWFPLVGDTIIDDGNSQLKTVSMVSAMFNIMCADDTKTSNKYQKRFLDTVDGINFPDDWENLSEVEKSKRLDKAVKVNL